MTTSYIIELKYIPRSEKGVSKAIWDVKTKKMHVEFIASETNSDEVQKAIAKTGHDTDNAKADKKTYNGLPGCCKYRK